MQASHRTPGLYEIRVQGRLEARWAAWFDGCTLTRADDGTTVIAGNVVDQAALHGLLKAVRDLGLPLLSVTSTSTPPATALPDPPGRSSGKDPGPAC